jgi:cyclic pyranopterin phosphate synthase
VYASTVDEVPATVSMLASHGVERVRLWLLSAAETSDENVRSDVPRLRDVARAAIAAREAVGSQRVVIESLHTPPCVFADAAQRDLAYDVAELGLTVVNPGGHAFDLEASPIEGGVYVDACSDCSARSRCRGLRADYIALHGANEVRRI